MEEGQFQPSKQARYNLLHAADLPEDQGEMVPLHICLPLYNSFLTPVEYRLFFLHQGKLEDIPTELTDLSSNPFLYTALSEGWLEAPS